jgi:K(+)-stimulated pyrophosphate-energized sodium pump
MLFFFNLFQAGRLIIDDKVRGKHSDEHHASIIGDTVGDPLKDTSGPAINILVKLMAIISLVFGGFFVKTGYLSKIATD